MLNAVKKSSFDTVLQLKVIKHAEQHSNRVVAIIIGAAKYMYMYMYAFQVLGMYAYGIQSDE